MKKMLSLLMILLLMSSVFSASATSLFPSIPTALTEEAPSYGALMDVDPLREETLDDGSLQQTYGGVSQENFDAYGVYLSEKGYTLPSHEYTDTSLIAAVKKDDIHFQVTFDWTTSTLVVIYPQGIAPEARSVENPFGDYICVSFGDVMKFEGLAEITAQEINSAVITHGYDEFSGYLLTCMLKNISPDVLHGYAAFNDSDTNGPISSCIYYINSDNVYAWPVDVIGDFHYKDEGRIVGFSVDPLVSQPIYAMYANIPADVYEASDGILAITFEHQENGTKYILYLRNNAE